MIEKLGATFNSIANILKKENKKENKRENKKENKNVEGLLEFLNLIGVKQPIDRRKFADFSDEQFENILELIALLNNPLKTSTDDEDGLKAIYNPEAVSQNLEKIFLLAKEVDPLSITSLDISISHLSQDYDYPIQHYFKQLPAEEEKIHGLLTIVRFLERSGIKVAGDELEQIFSPSKMDQFIDIFHILYLVNIPKARNSFLTQAAFSNMAKLPPAELGYLRDIIHSFYHAGPSLAPVGALTTPFIKFIFQHMNHLNAMSQYVQHLQARGKQLTADYFIRTFTAGLEKAKPLHIESVAQHMLLPPPDDKPKQAAPPHVAPAPITYGNG